MIQTGFVSRIMHHVTTRDRDWLDFVEYYIFPNTMKINNENILRAVKPSQLVASVLQVACPRHDPIERTSDTLSKDDRCPQR